MFSTIYLDVSFKDLYASWEEVNMQPIEYKTEQVKLSINKYYKLGKCNISNKIKFSYACSRNTIFLTFSC